jgi:DNA-binding transcriptional ArsR family regulator
VVEELQRYWRVAIQPVWERPAERSDPLAALVGRTRATSLASVDLPRSTTQLVEQLGLSPASVSQHLKVLKETALVTSRRRGRMVLYQRTAAATALLAAVRLRLSPDGD